MKKRLFLAAAAVISLCGAGMAQARDLNWAVSIGDPMVGAVISNGPVYGYAPRVHAPPPVVVLPAPRVVYERPYAYAPVPYGYATYGYVPHRHGRHDDWRWSRRYEERNRHGWRDHDRRNERGGRDDYRDDRDERRHRH